MKIKITEAQMKRLIEINLPSNEDPIGVLQRNILRLEHSWNSKVRLMWNQTTITNMT